MTPLEEALKACDEEISLLKTHEVGYLHTSDGRQVLRKEAADDAKLMLTFTPEEVAEVPGRVFTHNHPNGSSFSPEDIQFAYAHAPLEFRVVCERFTYTLRPPAGGFQLEELNEYIHPAFKRLYDKIHQPIHYKCNTGKITLDEYWERFPHELWLAVAADTELRYERVERTNDEPPATDGQTGACASRQPD
jgi:hypothetical protein